MDGSGFETNMEHHLSEERREELWPKDYATRYPTTRSNASWSEQEVTWASPKWESRMADEERETLLSYLLKVKSTIYLMQA